MFENQGNILNESIDLDAFFNQNITLSIKREDQIHSNVSGNKFRKLKYNIFQAQKLKLDNLLTFGGAFSNHIAATAAAGFEIGLKTTGVIRGDELQFIKTKNPTLSFAEENGMRLHFVTREDYKRRNDNDFLEFLTKKFGNFYLIPEGGTNELAVRGCEEILSKNDSDFDYICVPVGTGGTIAGLINTSDEKQTILGFSALKGVFQKETISQFTTKTNYKLLDDYCFGGYAKIDSQLVRFINDFKEKTQIPLDPVYTGKMMFGIFDLLKNGYFKENSRILAIHTGGLQGISGMNQLLKKKNLPQIEF